MFEILISIAILFGFLFLGMLLARSSWVQHSRMVARLTGITLCALLFFMGFRLGKEMEGTSQLTEIGILSLSVAIATALGTGLVLGVAFWVVRFSTTPPIPGARNYKPNRPLVNRKLAARHLKDPIALSACVALGYIAGSLFPYESFSGALASTWLLRLLLLSVGIDLARSQVDFRAAFIGKETIIVPLGTAAGSLAGGLCASFFFPVSPGESLSVAAGFGWYSLSGAIITDLGDPALGAVAFMSNIIRETIGLLTIPLVAASRYPLVAIGLGGATSMDVTLPVIERSCGPHTVPLSIASGLFLSLLVPFLVPIFYKLG